MGQRIQVTCGCTAYPFPHRIDGGKCDGCDWAESYRLFDGSRCDACNCLNAGESGCGGSRAGTCDVSGGLEAVSMGECYQDHMHNQPSERYPALLGDLVVDDRFGYGEVAL